jgi:hypothetical protein
MLTILVRVKMLTDALTCISCISLDPPQLCRTPILLVKGRALVLNGLNKIV